MALNSPGQRGPSRCAETCGFGQRSHAALAQAALTLAMCISGVSLFALGETARQIVEEAQRRATVYSMRYEGLLQVLDAKGRITDKRWTFERIGSNGESRSIVRFTAPAEVKGVALLIVNHPDRASDQWMWTPAVERDRRIAHQDRATRFFGTDFSFEDLEERDADQYEYQSLGEEPIDGALCWKIELTPTGSKSSQYTRTIAWIRQDSYAFARLDNYVDDEVRRRLIYSDIEKVHEIWTARVMEMTDLRRGSRTRLTLERLEYDLPLRDEDFTLQALRRQ